MKKSPSNGILGLFNMDDERVRGTQTHARKVELDNMNQKAQKMGQEMLEKKTDLDAEKRFVQHQQKDEMDFYAEEMRQKDMRRQQMADNIHASLRMRQEKDNELADTILKGEQKINSMKKMKPAQMEDYHALISGTPPVNLNPAHSFSSGLNSRA